MLPFLVWLLLSSLQNIIVRSEHHSIPSNFHVAIGELHQKYDLQKRSILSNFDDLLHMTNNLEQWFTNISISNHSNPQCERDLTVLVEGAAQRQLWALKVLDSWGKPLPSGLLKGNIFWTGNYDECLKPLYQPSNKSFLTQPLQTQYCTLMTNPSQAGSFISSNIVLGLCLPSSCDHQTIFPFIEALFNNSNTTEPSLHCANDPPNLRSQRLGGTITISIVVSLLILLVAIGTVFDILIRANYFDSSVLEKKAWSVTLAEFSAVRTLRYIFTMKKKENDHSFTFINGIRVLALLWVMFGHSFLFGMYYAANSLDVVAWSHNMSFQLILAGFFSVDTFFVVSGFLTTIIFLRQLAKEKLSFRLMSLYYIHRYIRLTPTFLLVMFISMYLSPYFGSGPLYPSQQGFESVGCHNHYWWTSIFYIGNLIRPDDICLSVSWYIFNDMQFHWIAPLALIPFALRRKMLAYGITILLVLISIVSITGLLVHYPQVYPNAIENALEQTSTSGGPNLFNVIYVAPWCRISAFAIGILTGFITIQTGPNCRLHIRMKVLGSLTAIILAFTCIFALYGDYFLVSGLNRVSIIAYEALSRSAWSLAIGWLLFICSVHQGGLVSDFLSWSIWAPLTRLSYATYLSHLTIIYIVIFNQTTPFYYQTLSVMNSFIAQVVFSYLTAVPIVVFFEAPFSVLERKLFKR